LENVKTAEHERLEEPTEREAWRRWGPYVSDRAWGTVREDYSAHGDAWTYFPHDHARSRAYRWNEDGLAGFCDRGQHLCLAVALWNERDPILKERFFGLSNGEGNHGEDAKEYWFHLDNVPTHAYAKMLYKYPQAAFPYADLVAENARRGPAAPEYELFDALADEFRAQRYFDVFVEYAKASPEDVLCRIRVVNRGPAPAPVHVLPHLWYRNTWSWGPGRERPHIEAVGPGAARTFHPALGERWWYVRASVDGAPQLLFTENETNFERLYQSPNTSPCVKDGIHEAVVDGRWDRVHAERGSKAAAHVHAVIQPGAELVVRVRFSPRSLREPFDRFDAIVATRGREADEFYAAIQAPHLTEDELRIQRQAYAGLLWSKQFYHFAVETWLQGDPSQPAPSPERRKRRNREWCHFFSSDVLLMPDKWEYPWFASWDLAFHCVVMASLDPEFAKEQIRTLTHPRFQHPYGTIPAYEWDFSAVNPPVIAWAAWQVYQLDRLRTGRGDVGFLASVFEPLLLMLGWWVNRKDSEGKGLFGGGFLGLDNIGVFDRDQPLPTGGTLEQSDATGWMAMFQVNMGEIALELALHDARYEPMLHRFGQHFAVVSNALRRVAAGGGLWGDEESFYFDAVRLDGSRRLPLKVYSIAGLVPLFAAGLVRKDALDRVPDLQASIIQVLERTPQLRAILGTWLETGEEESRLLSVADRDQLSRILKRTLDEDQFLSEFGVRSLSRKHHGEPYRFRVDGCDFEIAYAPGSSDSRAFGGNSNWRGPIWFPMNFLLIQALDAYGRYYGESFTVEFPTGSGRFLTLSQVAQELARRLVAIFLRDPARGGRRPVIGANEHMQRDPHWRDYIPFHEFFHGEDGTGLGASHQTGWTALVALLIQHGGALRFDGLPSPRTSPAELEALPA
jgi:mannosylglycerate hydrolase MGH1-like protein